MPLLQPTGVTDEDMSSFCKICSLPKDLLHEYIAYFQRKFSYNSHTGTQEVDNVMEDIEVSNELSDKRKRQTVASSIRQLVDKIENIEKRETSNDEDGSPDSVDVGEK